ncbi:hypothetical protein O6H91_11G013000 [Diphasiastrum complanatum]|uniref:Uncharacterized protein n=1 Tax=Diphasiastrum complanatum TaxID=34168 RepID=A0ACC2C6K3_DIPCM|nr:hypothetical protein O6H91_11G013000 [Diphasiastrum complanatum]
MPMALVTTSASGVGVAPERPGPLASELLAPETLGALAPMVRRRPPAETTGAGVSRARVGAHWRQDSGTHLSCLPLNCMGGLVHASKSAQARSLPRTHANKRQRVPTSNNTHIDETRTKGVRIMKLVH